MQASIALIIQSSRTCMLYERDAQTLLDTIGLLTCEKVSVMSGTEGEATTPCRNPSSK